MTRIAVSLVLLSFVLTSAGCRGAVGRESDADVVAAFYPLAFAASSVAPAGTTVANLTPAGAEPHDLELTPGQVAALRRARLVVFLGRGFQPAVQEAVASRAGPSLDVLAGQRLQHAPGVPGTARDPHIWLDPIRYAAVARAVAAALGDRRSADPFVARLRALDAAFARGLATCARRDLVTTHAAFGYLAGRYGLHQVPLAGLSPESEPGPRTLARLIDEVRATGATTVFFEPLLSHELARTVAREAHVTAASLDPLEGLTPSQERRGSDYFSVMAENLAALRKGLGCT